MVLGRNVNGSSELMYLWFEMLFPLVFFLFPQHFHWGRKLLLCFAFICLLLYTRVLLWHLNLLGTLIALYQAMWEMLIRKLSPICVCNLQYWVFPSHILWGLQGAGDKGKGTKGYFLPFFDVFYRFSCAWVVFVLFTLWWLPFEKTVHITKQCLALFTFYFEWYPSP